MKDFVDTVLRTLPQCTSDADIDHALGDLAAVLGYRSAYLLDFPIDETQPVRLWDSNAERAAWWREATGNGTATTSRALARLLSVDGVHHLNVQPDDARYHFAVRYDFSSTAIVPITFEKNIRGAGALCGDERDLTADTPSLQVVFYALLMQARQPIKAAPEARGVLTPREREVIALTAEGLTSEMVAASLGMSARTVNQHIDNVTGKLGSRNRAHAVAECIRRGYL